MDAELARLVAAGADDAARSRFATDDHGLAAQLRVVALLHRREERVEVHVDDREAADGHGQMMARRGAGGERVGSRAPCAAR